MVSYRSVKSVLFKESRREITKSNKKKKETLITHVVVLVGLVYPFVTEDQIVKLALVFWELKTCNEFNEGHEKDQVLATEQRQKK